MSDKDTGHAGPALPADALILLPVRNLVVFPGVALPVSIGRERTIAAAEEAVRSGRKVGFLLQRDPQVDEPGEADLHRVGTQASVLRYVTAPDGSRHVVVQGEQRFRVLDFLPGFPFLAARVEPLAEPARGGVVPPPPGAAPPGPAPCCRGPPRTWPPPCAPSGRPPRSPTASRASSTSSPPRSSACSRPWTSCRASTVSPSCSATGSRC